MGKVADVFARYPLACGNHVKGFCPRIRPSSQEPLEPLQKAIGAMKGEACCNVNQLEVLSNKSGTPVKISCIECIEQGSNDSDMFFC
jgi:hypothetical protein